MAWETMGLMAENVVVVKHAQPWRKLLGDARARLSWPNIKAAARSALTRERAVEFVVWLWPFKWWWLVAWVATLSLILAGHAVTSDVLPTTWHDVAMIWLANLCGGIYALKGRAAADAALSDANSFKTAGSRRAAEGEARGGGDAVHGGADVRGEARADVVPQRPLRRARRRAAGGVPQQRGDRPPQGEGLGEGHRRERARPRPPDRRRRER